MHENEQPLRDYTLAKHTVAATLQTAREFSEAQAQPELAEKLQELQARLAEDRFNLAVVGQFKQ